ncbi:Hypothetical predicted protein [Paramuricea clavata]|uniref:Uncharacterized protein n=1 Tax=Paramuricea clavata TaxID=317549 RepID=A0A7D9EYD8_PARCT|nr:Hypothetical predicted protein [Paramuricea clavata]
MGRDAGIRRMDYVSGGSKGTIIIFISVSELSEVTDCWFEGPEDWIHLGWHMDFESEWSCVPWTLQIEELREVERAIDGFWEESQEFRRANEEIELLERMEEEEMWNEIERVSSELEARGDDMVVEVSYGDLTCRCLIQENDVDIAGKINIRASIPWKFDVDFLSDVTLFGLPEFDPIYFGSPVKVARWFEEETRF